jgi:hypothetical protein
MMKFHADSQLPESVTVFSKNPAFARALKVRGERGNQFFPANRLISSVLF